MSVLLGRPAWCMMGEIIKCQVLVQRTDECLHKFLGGAADILQIYSRMTVNLVHDCWCFCATVAGFVYAGPL